MKAGQGPAFGVSKVPAGSSGLGMTPKRNLSLTSRGGGLKRQGLKFMRPAVVENSLANQKLCAKYSPNLRVWLSLQADFSKLAHISFGSERLSAVQKPPWSLALTSFGEKFHRL